MKCILYLILESGHAALETFESIKEKGYNGTVIESASLRHSLEDAFPEDKHFFSLANYERVMDGRGATYALFIEDENNLSQLKDTIRELTDGFKRVKGAMFSQKIEDYEGAF